MRKLAGGANFYQPAKRRKNMKDNINLSKVPVHVAVIMDGNGRWAKQQGAADRVFGHQNAIQSVRDVTEAAAEIGVKYLTLYAFSTENWGRPTHEVDALMHLLVSNIRKETKTLMDNKIKLKVIGEWSSLPTDCQQELSEALEATKDNDGMTLIVALSYSGRWELVRAVNLMLEALQHGEITAPIDAKTFEQYLTTQQIPDPELLIRTSGEMRISNFLLWQLAYSELCFLDVLWPDFRKDHFFGAILDYQKRERRFGKTSEQITNVS
jgi:undecaprenyl diphosphate synthase